MFSQNAQSVKMEIEKILMQNHKTPNYKKIGESLFKYIENNNIAVFGSVIHRMLTNSTYPIDNIDILVDYRNKEKNRLHKLPKKAYFKNVNAINFSKHIVGHDIVFINRIRVNFIFIDIDPHRFISNEIPHYFLKNFYNKGKIYQVKDDIMKELRLYTDRNDPIVKKYMNRNVIFKSMIPHHNPHLNIRI